MPTDSSRPVYVSGACEVDLARRELRVLGAVAAIGGRAFEIVEILIEAAGEVVTKDELIRRIWPGASISENTLQVHVAAVRKALGAHRGLLRTEARRGYRLLGSWSPRHDGVAPGLVARKQARSHDSSSAGNFPAEVGRLLGRSAALEKLQDLISAYRVVTLLGPGGIGKTALALTLAGRVEGEFFDGGWFVEFAPLSDPELVPSAVAGALALKLGTQSITPEAIAKAIGNKNILLVLDNCEHVIAAVAAFTEILVRLCPRATVVATSREVLRLDGEYAYRVPTLDVPGSTAGGSREILDHSAVELFVTRAREMGADFSSDVVGLQTIATICRRLDGIPLAIEFAAARVATLGIESVAATLHDRFAVLTSGRRSALPRHRTLRAALDWSYNLLSAAERQLLERLSVFSGSFSLAAAREVCGRGDVDEAKIADGMANLVAKSLVTSDVAANSEHFRLLETTRVYALSKLTESGGLREFSLLHARYFQRLLEAVDSEREKSAMASAHLDNARSALEWCFGANGDLETGVRLAAASTQVFLAKSLLQECHRWSERALRVLVDNGRGGSEEMHLQATFAVSSMQMRGQTDEAGIALSRALAIAEARGDVLGQVELLGMLSLFYVRDGDFRTSLRYAQRSRSVEGIPKNSAAMALANSTLGRAFQFVGEHSRSRPELEASFWYWSPSQQPAEVYLGYDHQILVGMGLARNRWFQGFPTQAIERTRQTIRDATHKNHPATLGLGLSWAPGIFLWTGDLQSAEEHADWLRSHAEAHSLGPYLAVARAYSAAVAIGRGDVKVGIEELERCLQQLRAMRYEMLYREFQLSLVSGLVAAGQSDASLSLIDETIDLIQSNGDLVHLPEALRLKGSILLSLGRNRFPEAQKVFAQSLELSRHQGARAWELRTSIDLAALWANEGQRDRARTVLEPVFGGFVEGFDTQDLKVAEDLLIALR